MDIYINLPIELQYKIVTFIIKEYKDKILMKSIIKKREILIKNKIKNLFEDNNKKNSFGYELFFWFNSNYPITNKKYLNFIKKIYPDYYLDLTLSSYIESLEKGEPYFNETNHFGKNGYLYIYYKKLYNCNYSNFIDFILDNLDISDLEDLFNFIGYKNYNSVVNNSEITKKNIEYSSLSATTHIIFGTQF